MRCFRDVKRIVYSLYSARAELRSEVAWLLPSTGSGGSWIRYYSLLVNMFIVMIVVRTSEDYFSAFVMIGLTSELFNKAVCGLRGHRAQSKSVESKVDLPIICTSHQELVLGFKLLVTGRLIGVLKAFWACP
jgi:hypothetical protein